MGGGDKPAPGEGVSSLGAGHLCGDGSFAVVLLGWKEEEEEEAYYLSNYLSKSSQKQLLL